MSELFPGKDHAGEIGDDGVKGLFYGSRVLYEELQRMGKMDVRYTEYEAEFIHERYGYKAHCAWLPALESEEVREWLFSYQWERGEKKA